MDRLIYTALSGQNAIDARMRQVANELANVNTTGFKRAYSAAMTTMRYDGDGWSSRFAATMQDSNAVDLTPGPSVATGRELDVALAPAQLFQVVLPDGSNVYTSRGDLMVGPDGTLRNGEGVAIAATGGGALNVPPNDGLKIGTDGTILIRALGDQTRNFVPAGRIAIADAETARLVRRPDGLFQLADGGALPAAASGQLTPGMLESSNTNVFSHMVDMIAMSRAYETHIKIMKQTEELSQRSSSMARLNN